MIRFIGRPTSPSASCRSIAVAVVAGLVMVSCSSSSTTAKTTVASATTTAATSSSAPSDSTAVTTATTAPKGPDLGKFEAITGVPGVSDKEIKFAVEGTGPSNPLGYCLLECYKQGVQAYFDYRNSLGGVNGRKLVISTVVDDELGNTQVKLLELTSSDNFGIFASPLTYPGYADVAKANVPMYSTVPAAAEANGFKSIFLPTGTACIACPSRQNVEIAILAKAHKVGSLGYGISQASKDCVAGHKATFDKWGPAVGIELAYSNAELPFGLPNGLGPEVTAMKEAGVDFILTCIDSGGALTLEQELERQGMGKVVVSLPQGYSDTAFASKNAALLEGDILSPFFHPLEATPLPSGLSTYVEWMGKGGYAVNDYGIQGWINADLAVMGILAAGSKFDRASVIDATNKITNYTAGGIVATVDWTRQHLAPTIADPVSNAAPKACAAYVTIIGGKFKLLGDSAKPFFCFDPKVDKWVDATPTVFG